MQERAVGPGDGVERLGGLEIALLGESEALGDFGAVHEDVDFKVDVEAADVEIAGA